tara:strand:- start:227 stop:418 length:192 start_codon:yes stop_codon:yes gene_type:complete
MSDIKANSSDEEEYIKIYKEQLSEIENIVLEIAINNLETSFDIVKSIGFIEWKDNYLNSKKIE